MKMNKVCCIDCLEGLEHIDEGIIDLIYIDPPFGDNVVDKKIGCKWNEEQDDYLFFMQRVLKELFRVLKKTGSIYIHCDWRSDYHLRFVAEEIGFKFQNAISWCYKKGGGMIKNRFRRVHDTILFMTKTEEYTFNTPLTEYGTLEKDYWMIDSIADSTRFSGSGKLLTPYQKPIELLQKIINVSSNKGDIVLDCFGGSGTTALASKLLGRYFLVFDNNKTYVEIANKRLNQKTLGDYEKIIVSQNNT